MARVLVAPDKFKGTLGAAAAASAIAAGWRLAAPRAETEELPVADGGDGTLDALVAALGGRTVRVEVTGPLGDPVEAAYGLIETAHGLMGVVEMARASGLHLIAESRRDAKRATTRGTGELIVEAARAGATRLLVCIGGSGTNDAGAGMAQAMGVRLLDERGREIAPGGGALERLARIDVSSLDPAVASCDVTVACDVDNPMTGPRGATATYGPQKGATPEDVMRLDRALAHFAAVAFRDLGIDVREIPGAGAAGGMGGGLVALLGAHLRPGFDLVAEALGLEERLQEADIAVTGEGRYDRQSSYGKAPAGVLRMAREAGCRSVLVAGQVEEGVKPDADLVIDLSARVGLEAAMERTKELLEEAGTEAAREMGDG